MSKLGEDIPDTIYDPNTRLYFIIQDTEIINDERYSIYHNDAIGESLIVKPDGDKFYIGGGDSTFAKAGNKVLYFYHGWVDIVSQKSFRCADFEAENYPPIEIGGHLYWMAKSNDTKNFAIIEDDHVKIGHSNTKIEGNLREIEKQLTYISNERGFYFIHWGDKPFGPYDEIKLCENSKDNLIFYYRKGDEHFVWAVGHEKKINRKEIGEIKGITYATAYGKARKTINLCFTEAKKKDSTVIFDLIDGELRLCDEYRANCSNFCDINGRLFYTLCYVHGAADRVVVYWDTRRHETDIDVKNYTKLKAVGYRNSIFITDGNRVLTQEYSNNDFEFKEIKFDGEVEAVNSGGKLFIIESLPDKKRIWEWSEKFELTEHEQKDLDLANAVAKEDLPEIEEYFKKYYPEEEKKSALERIKSGIKSDLEQSKRFVNTVNQTIKEKPELFLSTLRAKDDKPTEYLMTEMFYYMFPEARERRERALKDAREKRNSGGGFGGGGGYGGKGETYDYDPGVDRLASTDESGYYEMLKANREVLRLREPLPAGTFITHGIFGNYTGKSWSKVDVPISEDITEPAKETTFEFVDEKASANINLPKIANAKILTERLKGVTADGAEVPVEILEENNLGEVRVKKPKGVRHIAYSQNYSELPKTMTEITASDYEKFRKDFEKSFGDAMTKEIGDIGDELDIFIRSIKGKSPREQVIAIQEFCYQYGYYNLDNEVRDTDNFEERLAIMEGRMDELKAKKPELAGKKYAGICTDFATLCSALLRKAGFVSGIASGFVPKEGDLSIKTSQAHAVSYVLWPHSAET